MGEVEEYNCIMNFVHNLHDGCEHSIDLYGFNNRIYFSRFQYTNIKKNLKLIN